MLLGTPGLATAQPAQDPDGIAALIADVADANQQLQNLGAQIAEEKEGVNKALVDLQTARDDAAAAQHEVDAGFYRRSPRPTPRSPPRSDGSTLSPRRRTSTGPRTAT